MNNIKLAQTLAFDICKNRAWPYDWDSIFATIEENISEAKIEMNEQITPLSTIKIGQFIQTWECIAEISIHEAMREVKAKQYENKIVYTIQNEHGDKGWIQYIDENCRAYDEVSGNSHDVNPDYFHSYLVISKEEYDIIKNLHMLWEETNIQEYFDMIETMIDLTIEKNKKNLF